MRRRFATFRLPGFLFSLGFQLAAISSTALAQKAPEAGYVFPPGGQAGTTVDVRLGGCDWTPDVQFLVHEPGVVLQTIDTPGDVLMPEPPYWFGIKSMVNDPPLPREVSARLTLPVDVPAGPIHWRVANANGGSNTGVFMVGQGDELIEDEQRVAPQELSRLPVTVSGRLGRIEEVDRYRFQAPRDGVVTCELMARRLGSDFHGVLEIRDGTNRILSEVVDTQGVDPVLTFAARAGAWYTVDVRDFDFRGYRSYVYRLTVTAGPRILAALPAAGHRGTTVPVEFIGIGVASGCNKLERVTRKIAFSADPARTAMAYRLETPHGIAPAFALFLSDLPEFVDASDGNQPIPKLTGPGGVTALMDRRAGKKQYTIQCKKDEFWAFSAEARRIGSPLDLTLTLFGPDGKEIAQNDDAAGTTDPTVEFKAAADGLYRIEVADVSSRESTEVAAFRLVADRRAADFSLRAVPEVNVPVGGKKAFAVNLTRLGDFKEAVKLTVRGLPSGVTARENPTIPATATGPMMISLEAAKDAPAAAALVEIIGTAIIGDRTVAHTALAPAAGNLAPRCPAETLVSRILVASTLKPPFKVTPVEADGGRRVHRGATYPAELIVERFAGFRGEIVLDMAATQSRHRQGIRGPVLTVPNYMARIAYPVVVPEWLETTRTSRLALVAMARIPDGRGTLRYVLSPMTGQITMAIEGALLKLSHTAEDLAVLPGQTLVVPLKIARASRLDQPVRVEFLVPEPLRDLLRAESLVVPRNQEAVDWTLKTSDSPRLAGRRTLTVRASTTAGGLPVISETVLDVEFLPARPEKTRKSL
jgi:hypothetical protein